MSARHNNVVMCCVLHMHVQHTHGRCAMLLLLLRAWCDIIQLEYFYVVLVDVFHVIVMS